MLSGINLVADVFMGVIAAAGLYAFWIVHCAWRDQMKKSGTYADYLEELQKKTGDENAGSRITTNWQCMKCDWLLKGGGQRPTCPKCGGWMFDK